MPELSSLIKQKAHALGFDACGICRAAPVGEQAGFLKQWLDDGHHAGMRYMENYFDKRTDPSLLLEGSPARSVIVTALNYYPAVKRNPDFPSFAYYAYGQDYHDIVRDKLRQLLAYAASEYSSHPSASGPETLSGRVFCDTAPILEKYHAEQAGIGWIGKNTLLIIPGKGSYFFIGIILVDVELKYDAPMENRCGSCRRCLEACPTKALEKPFVMNAGKCISYLTIEHKGAIPDEEGVDLKANVYGCDICAEACPWNRFSTPHHTPGFTPSELFLRLDKDALDALSEDEFKEIFRHSAVRRAGYAGLKRNVSSLRKRSGE